MAKLTKRVVDASKVGQRDYFVWDEGDGAIKGFGLRVRRGGSRTFVFQYRDASGRTRRIRIGDSGMAAEKARSQARKLATAADDARTDHEPARDPAAQRAKEKAKNAAPNVADLAQLFLADRKKKVKPKTLGEYRRLIDREITPTIGRRDVQELSRGEVAAMLAKIDDRPTTANNVHALTRAIFSYAIDHDIRLDGRNPGSRIRRYPTRSPKKSLTSEQYAALGAALTRAERDGLPVPPALRKLSHGTSHERRAKATGKKRGPYKARDIERVEPANPVAVAVLRFLALSGWREGEALTLRRDAVDLERAVAVLADTKTGRSVRPLGKDALDVLSATISAHGTRGNPYVFVGALAGEHLRETKRLWTAAKHAAGLQLRLHDLRHSFTTVGRELDCSDYTIARLVGHVVEGMTGRYGDVPDETVRKAANAIAETIANRLAGRTADVLVFGQQRAG